SLSASLPHQHHFPISITSSSVSQFLISITSLPESLHHQHHLPISITIPHQYHNSSSASQFLISITIPHQYHNSSSASQFLISIT
ncbi:hypothetical protein BOX15_Mlig004800g2, partial [Macrostomum lignano]